MFLKWRVSVDTDTEASCRRKIVNASPEALLQQFTKLIRLFMDRKSKYTPLLLCLLVILALLFSPPYPSFCLAKNVTLGWRANSEPDLEGYVVYRNVGSPGPPYKYEDTLPEDDLANPLKPRVVMTGLKKETEYYVAVTAYDVKGNESDFSNDLCIEIVDEFVQACSQSVSPSTSKSSSGGGSGGSSGGCFISSASLKTSASTMEPLFISQQQETFFVVLFLLLIAAAKAILSKTISYKAT